MRINTICRYLVTRRGTGELLPAEPHRRARVEMWMDWQATDLNGTWGPAFHVLARKIPPCRCRHGCRQHRQMDGQDADPGRPACGYGRLCHRSAFTSPISCWDCRCIAIFDTAFAHAALPAVRRCVTRLGERDGFRRYAHGNAGVGSEIGRNSRPWISATPFSVTPYFSYPPALVYLLRIT